jgi:hypothetical protein
VAEGRPDGDGGAGEVEVGQVVEVGSAMNVAGLGGGDLEEASELGVTDGGVDLGVGVRGGGGRRRRGRAKQVGNAPSLLGSARACRTRSR